MAEIIAHQSYPVQQQHPSGPRSLQRSSMQHLEPAFLYHTSILTSPTSSQRRCSLTKSPLAVLSWAVALYLGDKRRGGKTKPSSGRCLIRHEFRLAQPFLPEGAQAAVRRSRHRVFVHARRRGEEAGHAIEPQENALHSRKKNALDTPAACRILKIVEYTADLSNGSHAEGMLCQRMY